MKKYLNYCKSNSSFTLIELLVVIAILAILAVVVVVVINPSELLKQARDSTRLSDLQTLNKAIALFQADQVGKSLGDPNTIYIFLFLIQLYQAIKLQLVVL